MKQLKFQDIQISLFCLDPVFFPTAEFKALSCKELLACGVALVDGAIHLMEQQMIKKVFEAQGQSGFGIALLTVGLVDEDAQSRPLVEGIVVVDVDAAYGLPVFGQVNHQAELLCAEQVVVVQQELLNLETGIGHMGAAHSPDVAVVLPKENLSGILRLGATQRYRVILDEHIV